VRSRHTFRRITTCRISTSETDVKEKGVSVGEIQAKLLAKIEELTLHMIQADERNDRLERQNQELRDRIARLEKGATAK
jgi:hypothetical protein